MTGESKRQAYIKMLKQLLRAGGYALFSAFAVGGAAKCSGLEVVNYDKTGRVELLGEQFELETCDYYTYTMPSGALRPYVSAFFQKKIAP